MSKENPIFNNPEKAMAIVSHFANTHEMVVESITEMCKESIIHLLPVFDEFMDNLGELSIPSRMLNNVENVEFIRNAMNNLIEKGNASRYDYDLFVMNMLDSIRDVISIGIDQANLVFKTYAFQMSETVDNVDLIREEFISLFDKVTNKMLRLTKEYASL
jgi:hypothetical protein